MKPDRSKMKLIKPSYAEGFVQIPAEYDDESEFELDDNGYLLIRTFPETGQIEVGFCKSGNVVEFSVIGKTPLSVYQTFLNKSKKESISRLDHAAYLGRELQRAYESLRLGVAYHQDKDNDIRHCDLSKAKKE